VNHSFAQEEEVDDDPYGTAASSIWKMVQDVCMGGSSDPTKPSPTKPANKRYQTLDSDDDDEDEESVESLSEWSGDDVRGSNDGGDPGRGREPHKNNGPQHLTTPPESP